MEPTIQYAQTADGVSIAFWTLGEGMPLVYMPQPLVLPIQMELRLPELRAWYDRLSQRRRLIRFDNRGSGLSQRDVSDYSLEALGRDIEAVIDRLGLDTFSLWAEGDAGPVAIAFAARRPQRVKHLLLWCTWARADDIAERASLEALEGLIDADWRRYTETIVHSYTGWSARECRRSAAAWREGVSAAAWKAFMAAAWEFDVTELLPSIRCPTLVLHRREAAFVALELSARLASSIADAHLVVLEGEYPLPYRGDTEPVIEAIDSFLGDGSQTAGARPPPGAGLVTILFTDLTSSTALTQRLGDAKAQELLRAHNSIVREALKEHGGQEIKHTGDGIMASFPSASNALHCAIVIQRAVEGHSVGAHGPFDSAQGRRAPLLQVHIGLNAGEPVAEDQDLFGTSVQLARRICDQAEGGEILASDVVRQLVAGKGFLFADRGEAALKGFEDPVRLWEVRWAEGG